MKIKSPLRRLGNKTKIANEIVSYFPKHRYFVDMFCGSLAISLQNKAEYTFCNDLDSNVFNFFTILQDKEKASELVELIEYAPYDMNLFNDLKRKDYVCKNDVFKAFRFLYLSNYSLKGNADTLQIGLQSSQKVTLQNLKNFLQNCNFYSLMFLNRYFRNLLNSIGHINDHKQDTFVYADKPYYNTRYMYENKSSWKKDDDDAVFEVLVNSGFRFAISEFLNDYTKGKAKEYNLNLIEVCERKTIATRNTEILICNYDIEKKVKPLF